MLQIAVVQFSKRPRRANSEKQKNAAKSAKKDFCYFFKEMVPIQVKKLHKKIFATEIPWDIVAKNTF